MSEPSREKIKTDGLYVFKEDWRIIDEYFRLMKGRSALTKTAALRTLIHTWVQRSILPALHSLRKEIPAREINLGNFGEDFLPPSSKDKE